MSTEGKLPVPSVEGSKYAATGLFHVRHVSDEVVLPFVPMVRPIRGLRRKAMYNTPTTGTIPPGEGGRYDSEAFSMIRRALRF